MNDDKLDFGLLVDRYIKIRDKKSQLQKARDAEAREQEQRPD